MERERVKHLPLKRSLDLSSLSLIDSLWVVALTSFNCSVMQELANTLQAPNPDREFPSSWESNYPQESFVRRFIKQNNLVMRRTNALSKARAELTVLDLDSWYKDVEGRFIKNPKFAGCFTDPRRMYNQEG